MLEEWTGAKLRMVSLVHQAVAGVGRQWTFLSDLKRDDFRIDPNTDGHSRLQQVGQDQKEQTEANVEVHVGAQPGLGERWLQNHTKQVRVSQL